MSGHKTFYSDECPSVDVGFDEMKEALEDNGYIVTAVEDIDPPESAIVEDIKDIIDWIEKEALATRSNAAKMNLKCVGEWLEDIVGGRK